MSTNYLATAIYDTASGGLKTYTQLKPRVPRTTTIASSATPTANCDTTDRYVITALAVDMEVAEPTGTPGDGQTLLYEFTDNGVARSIGWASGVFKAHGTVLPSATSPGKLLTVGVMRNTTQGKWLVVVTVQEV